MNFIGLSWPAEDFLFPFPSLADTLGARKLNNTPNHPDRPILPKPAMGLLRDVSRSFYLTLRILPAPIRPQIGLAYLLARATDTIADTALVPLDQRLAALASLRDAILGQGSAPRLGTLSKDQSNPAERLLLERIDELLQWLDNCSADDRLSIRQVLDTITSGQILDLQRFGSASASAITPLANDHELDDYTYRVAGCVGEFWTRLCRRHLFPQAPLDEAWLLQAGKRFGQGLQLVNILRDLPGDLRQGRCYMPADRLQAIGLQPADLAQPANEARFRPLYQQYLQRAADHLSAGWDYTNALPRGQVRLRLACAWPILFGIKTLAKLQQASMLSPDSRTKITRAELRAIMVRSLLWYAWPSAWQKLFATSGGSALSAAEKELP